MDTATGGVPPFMDVGKTTGNWVCRAGAMVVKEVVIERASTTKVKKVCHVPTREIHGRVPLILVSPTI